jgi:hypothetical protein
MAEPSLNMETYKMCREESRHEFEILSGRMSTFILSQSFLVSAFAVAMGNLNPKWGHTFRIAFPGLICVMGLVLSFRAEPGITAACNMIRHWHHRQDTILETDEELQKYYGFQPKDQSRIHARDILFAQTAPYIFGMAWLAFLALTAYLTAAE